jgi:protein-tyrosine phosphatase
METPSTKIAGLIDIHCHLLPGVDDGCADLGETIQCIGLLKQAGFVQSICTPHVGIEKYAANRREVIQQRVRQLQQELAARGIEYQLTAGAEIRLPKSAEQLMEVDALPLLAQSNIALFDWWGKDWPKHFDAYFDKLQLAGIQCMLAHPERLPMDDRLFHATIDRLLDRGVWLQGNLKSFQAETDERVQRKALALLKANCYHIIASDSHGPRSIPSRIKGLQRLRELISEAQISEVMIKRPGEILR